METIRLLDKTLQFCRGCLSCQKTEKCVLKDDGNDIAEKVKNADVVVFATPVYYYAMSGQLKTLIDRMNCLFPSNYRFRAAYLIATAADTDESALDGAIKEIECWAACFSKVELKGVLYGVGLNGAGEAKGNPALLKQAYAMGKTMS